VAPWRGDVAMGRGSAGGAASSVRSTGRRIHGRVRSGGPPARARPPGPSIVRYLSGRNRYAITRSLLA